MARESKSRAEFFSDLWIASWMVGITSVARLMPVLRAPTYSELSVTEEAYSNENALSSCSRNGPT